MPVLNYDPEEKDMPDLNAPQQCDRCGVQHIGRDMWYSYSCGVSILCSACDKARLKMWEEITDALPVILAIPDQPCQCESPDIVEWLEVCQRCGGNIEAARAEMENIRIEII
jgi:hypothetical protein